MLDLSGCRLGEVHEGPLSAERLAPPSLRALALHGGSGGVSGLDGLGAICWLSLDLDHALEIDTARMLQTLPRLQAGAACCLPGQEY